MTYSRVLNTKSEAAIIERSDATVLCGPNAAIHMATIRLDGERSKSARPTAV